jgi:hypothetical protein
MEENVCVPKDRGTEVIRNGWRHISIRGGNSIDETDVE